MSFQIINNKSFTLKFIHSRDIYLDLIRNQIENVQYEITVTNTTQRKTVRFSDTRPRNEDNSFIISLEQIPGQTTDEFDIVLRAYTTDDQLGLLTWGRLDSYKLLQRKTVDPFRTLLPQILSVLTYSIKLAF